MRLSRAWNRSSLFGTTINDRRKQHSDDICAGRDHGGFELENLKAHLDGQGIAVQDYGPVSDDSCDYPDFAQAVARSVASGQHTMGLLICKTGIGMSIAANKISECAPR